MPSLPFAEASRATFASTGFTSRKSDTPARCSTLTILSSSCDVTGVAPGPVMIGLRVLGTL